MRDQCIGRVRQGKPTGNGDSNLVMYGENVTPNHHQLPPMTQYDAGATPMFNSFAKSADATPYQAITPKIDLFAKNTGSSPGAKQSSTMDFHDYDLAPEDELNRVLWLAAKGPNVPYPTPIHRALLATSGVEAPLSK